MPWPGRASNPPAPPPASLDPAEAPRWLTYRCVACGARVYSGFTASALARALRGEGLVKPDFFHADCAVETPLEGADLRDVDGRPWNPQESDESSAQP